MNPGIAVGAGKRMKNAAVLFVLTTAAFAACFAQYGGAMTTPAAAEFEIDREIHPDFILSSQQDRAGRQRLS